MSRIVIRPRIQIPILVVLLAVWTLLGVTYFLGTQWPSATGSAWCWDACSSRAAWPGSGGALRLGVVIDAGGVRVRGFDSRDKVTPWSAIQSVDCAQVDVRAGLPLYAPVLRLGDDDAMPLSALGSYSRQDAERKVEQLRNLKHGAPRS